jgi:hypothetical protein
VSSMITDLSYCIVCCHCEVCSNIKLRMWIIRYCILGERMMWPSHVLLLPLSMVRQSGWNVGLWSDTDGWYRMARVSLNWGRPTFSCQRSTVIVCWFGGSREIIRLCASLALLNYYLRIFYSNFPLNMFYIDKQTKSGSP